MPGTKYRQAEIDAYKSKIREAIKKGTPPHQYPKSCVVGKVRIQNFCSGGYDLDQESDHLYKGNVENPDSVDYGKKRLVLAKDNPDHQDLAKQYLLTELIHRSDSTLVELQQLYTRNPETGKATYHLQPGQTPKSKKKGKNVMRSIFDKLLNSRFESSASDLTNGWDFARFCDTAQAYVDLFRYRNKKKDLQQIGANLSCEIVGELTIQAQQTKYLINSIMIPHIDEALDEKSEEIHDLKEQMRQLQAQNQEFYKHREEKEKDNDKKFMEVIKDDVMSHLTLEIGALELRLKGQIDDVKGQIDHVEQHLQGQIDLLKENIQIGGNNNLRGLKAWNHPITTKDEFRIAQALLSRNDHHVVPKVMGSDFKRLSPGRWLNDVLIDHFMKLLKLREDQLPENLRGCEFFTPYFVGKLLNLGHATKNGVYEYTEGYTKRKKIEIFKCKKIFVPINVDGNHWYLVVVDMEQQKIQAYDSFQQRPTPRLGMLKVLFQFLQDEHRNPAGDSHKYPFPELDDWKFIDTIRNETPMQKNLVDCGVFVCVNTHLLSLGRSLQFAQEDITGHGRYFMARSILNRKVDVA